MIKYDEKNKIFHLTNNSISYYLYLNDAGYLETLYFGQYLSEIFTSDGIRKAYVDNNATEYFSFKDQKECTYTDNFKSTYALLEMSSHGLNDKRGAPVVLKYNNGSTVTNFKYVNHEIYKGIKPLSNLPHALNHDDCETLEILLKEKYHDIFCKFYLTIYLDKDIVVKNFEIINKSDETVFIQKAFSMQLDLNNVDYRFVHFRGCWAKERDYIINDVHDGIQEVASNFGRSSHDENPFVYLQKKDASNECGEVIGFNLIYSGNFKFRMFNSYFHNLHITYGINDEDFLWNLGPNESFVTPQAVISYSYQGVDKMSQNFHRFIKEDLITYEKDKDYKPVLFNSWEGCYFDFTTESIISYIDDSKKINAELFVLDDGWFGRRNDDFDGLGDWWINTKKIDLSKVIKHCHDNNMKFGIWFEPEMVNPKSDLFLNNPSYILGESNQDLTIHRHQFHLDFSNKEVVDNIYRQMVDILDKYQIDYIKWDYNRTVSESFSQCYDASHQGEIYHRLVLGYYDLISRLRERYPHIMFEGCASGGGRFDMGTLFYCPQIWCSDESDPIQRIFIQYNTSLGYPLSTIGSHANANPITSYKTKASIALFGSYGYEMNPNKLTKTEIDELVEIASIYKKYHQEVICNGTLYHILSPVTTNFICMMSVSQKKDKALILLMNKLKETDQYRFIKLKGLDEKKKYINNFDNRIYTGEYLMKVGLNFTFDWFDEFKCRLIEINEI